MDILSRHAARCVLLAAFAVCGAVTACAQISPGDLTSAHASLEGMGNCTTCHSLGREVTNAKCLDCHAELRRRISAGKGYHARLTGKECSGCHSEHHGRTFMIVRFDAKSFDHAQTGFVLEGKHRPLDCVRCHTQRNITAKDIRANAALMGGHTYLGLATDCTGCHEDRHRGQLALQCQTCHSADGWKPAARFVHDRARYRLTGKHVRVDCAKCHRPMREFPKTIQYVNLVFDRCSSCHADPHGGRFTKPCESCHSTEGWQTVATKNFDHATTKFPLRGRHASVRCEECHIPVRGADGRLLQSFVIRNFQRCTDCHQDVHRGEFARSREKGACGECHSEEGWARVRFDHATARYQLKGRHEKVECGKCHGAVTLTARGQRVPPDMRVKRFDACAACHEDAHGGQLRHRKDGGACEACHSVDGFLPASYSPEDHAKFTKFPLAGGHEAVPCAKCHESGKIRARSTVQFVWKTPPTCETCHRDPHGGQFARMKYAGCESCHSPKAWNALTFNHDRTNFPLKGKHASVACVDCHTPVVDAGAQKIRRYAGTPTRCVDCHRDINARPESGRRL